MTETSPIRADRFPLANFGSNELIHDSLEDLHSALIPELGSINRYPRPQIAVSRLAEALQCDPAEILLTPGSHVGIAGLVDELAAASGDAPRLILPAYEYPAWATAAARWGIKPTWLPGEGSPATEVVMASLSKHPSIVAMSWPNGPVGTRFSLAEMLELNSLCIESGGKLVVDGCYSAFDQGLDPLWELTGAGATVVLTSSKMFGLASARFALIRSSSMPLTPLRRTGIEDSISHLSLIRGVWSFGNQSLFSPLWLEIQQQRERIRDSLVGRGFTVPESGGNFLHVQTATASSAVAISERLLNLGYRVKANTAFPRMASIRFTIGVGQQMNAFVETLMDVLGDENLANR